MPHDDAVERPALRAKRAPHEPTDQEREDHMVSHVPYRAWCRHCVAGRGRSEPHQVREHSDDAIPEVAIDYGYLQPKEEEGQDDEGSSPILVLRVVGGRWTASEALPSKGTTHDHNVKTLVDMCVMTGLAKFRFKSDQERALLAVKRSAMKILKETHGVTVIPEESPVGESQANGTAEGAVRDVKGLVRTLRHSVEELHGTTVGPSHPSLPWMVRHASSLYNRGQRDANGRTPYELIKGKPYRRQLPAFAEKIFYLPSGKRVSRLVDRWLEGIFLGIVDRSDEIFVGTSVGVFRARSFKRMPLSARVDKTLFSEIKGVPWDPVPGSLTEGNEAPAAAIKIVADAVVPDAGLPPPVRVVGDPPAPKRVYIRKEVELQRYGYTENCQGCLNAALGYRSGVHSEACRARIEAAMMQDTVAGGAERVMLASRGRTREELAQEDQPDAKRRREEQSAAATSGSGSGGATSSTDDPMGLTVQSAREIGALLNQLGAYEGRLSEEGPDVTEVFNPGEFCRLAPVFDLRPGIAMDLRTGWDFTRSEDRERAKAEVTEGKPAFLVCSSVCSPFSQLQTLNDRTTEKYKAKLKEARMFLDFTMELCGIQAQAGRFFIHEHPWGALSWNEASIQKIRSMAGVSVVKGHQCGFGQTAKRRDGSVGPVLKPTGWMTNSREVCKRVGVLCVGGHAHVPLVDNRAKATERYPVKLVKEILRGIRDEIKIGAGLNTLSVGVTAEEAETLDGASAEEIEEFFDGISGAKLDTDAVRRARLEEMAYMERLGVFERVSVQQCLGATGKPPIPSGWVDVNKGDAERVEIRARLVAKETKRLTTLGPEDAASTFAATPPLEGLRLLLSMAMSSRSKRVLTFVDISRAHLHSELRREVYLRAPPEDSACGGDECWRLLKAMYGLKDAGASFDMKVERIMKDMGAVQGDFSPCVYRLGDVVIWRHGDDFVILGDRKASKEVCDRLGEKLIVKIRGTLGPEPWSGDVEEIVVLNRIVRWCRGDGVHEERLEYEPDPRHVEIVLQQLGLDAGRTKTVSTPGTKGHDYGGPEVLGEEHRLYRSICMRLAYLGQDRPDIQYACKEAARVMQTPTVGGWTALKRIGRYLAGCPRIVAVYEKQPPPTTLQVWTDSDFGGCLSTRKSTSSATVMHGRHWIRSSSTTQQFQALSTGESEFHALVKGGSMGLGFETLMKDMGLPGIQVELMCDATAGKGIAERRGVGRVRHLHVPLLWIQRVVQEGRLRIRKVDGTSNVADMGTNHVEAALIRRFLKALCFEEKVGRSRLALKAALAASDARTGSTTESTSRERNHLGPNFVDRHAPLDCCLLSSFPCAAKRYVQSKSQSGDVRARSLGTRGQVQWPRVGGLIEYRAPESQSSDGAQGAQRVHSALNTGVAHGHDSDCGLHPLHLRIKVNHREDGEIIYSW